ncbi:STAS domain-containing protein [Desulfospira joergensenii]|uniref:STAS domain-containing protein n=1 Tax=Desulfospira joergensenii TaxID=53329 RepID=UPI0003B36469|nr:STAS domain-containing protein [Desulfospira joergensenii]
MIKTVGENGIIELVHQGPLTGVQVSALKEKLTGHFSQNKGVLLAFSQTKVCDSLGIQLLCACSKTAAAQDKSFILKGDLDCILDMAERTGLTPEDYFILDKKET